MKFLLFKPNGELQKKKIKRKLYHLHRSVKLPNFNDASFCKELVEVSEKFSILPYSNNDVEKLFRQMMSSIS